MLSKLCSRVSNILSIAVLVLLYMTSVYNYPLFYILSELFNIFIALSVFMIIWNSYIYLKNNSLIIIGISYLFIGLFYLFHVLLYKETINYEYDDIAIRLWIAGRFFESIMFTVAFLSVRFKRIINVYYVFGVNLILASLFAAGIIYGEFNKRFAVFMNRFNMEYIISFLLIVALIILIRNKGIFDRIIYIYLLAAVVSQVFGELFFLRDVKNGYPDILGHFCKMLSFYFIYKSIIVKGIREPFDTIFREMKLIEIKLEEQNRILKNQAIIDGLTGLVNHRYLYEELDKVANKSIIYGTKFVVLLLDIDYFKKINDTYGHIVGDVILKELSQILKVHVRMNDIVGRYGGEEFLIILSDCDDTKGYQIAEEIRQSVENHEFSNNIRCTISIGVEAFKGNPVSELIGNADNKLYIAKNNGRNRSVM